MDLYFKMLGKPVFGIRDVMECRGNPNTARSALAALVGRGQALRIRNGLYTCVSGETGAPVANRYQIACAAAPGAYISHHTAMEYHGAANQAYNEVYVSSERRFRDFGFDGTVYKWVMSRSRAGVQDVPFSGGVRVAGRERAAVDSIRDMDRISGMEEVVRCLEGLGRLSEDRLLECLEAYDSRFLYQKTGWLLERFAARMGLGRPFFDLCGKRIGRSKRYLSADVVRGRYDARWRLVVPRGTEEGW